MTTELGPKRVQKILESAVTQGAIILTGGKPFGPGYYFEPTLVTGARRNLDCTRRKYLVLSCQCILSTVKQRYEHLRVKAKMADDAQAISMANATDMGLTNYVFTET
jgi:acyl-CoA reductase-like NAD-dependent aldehyde dehydrogenase